MQKGVEKPRAHRDWPRAEILSAPEPRASRTLSGNLTWVSPSHVDPDPDDLGRLLHSESVNAYGCHEATCAGAQHDEASAIGSTDWPEESAQSDDLLRRWPVF